MAHITLFCERSTIYCNSYAPCCVYIQTSVLSSAVNITMPSGPHLPRRPKVHKSHSSAMKLEALEFAAQYGDEDAAFSFNTTRKTIRDWRKQEEVIKRIVGDGLGKKKRKEGGGRPIKHPELELLLPNWIKDKRRKEGNRVTVKQVQKRGNLILQEMGKEGNVKYGAIWRMKERAGLSIRRRSTENQYKHDDKGSVSI